MRQLLSLLSLDLKNVWLTLFPLMMIGNVAIQGAIIRWLVPTELNFEAPLRLVDNTRDRAFEKVLAKKSEWHAPSEKVLSQWIAEDTGRVGLVFSGSRQDPKLKVLHDMRDDQGILQMARTGAATMWSRFGGVGWHRGHRVTHLGEARRPPPFNGQLLGIFLAADVAMSAMFFLAMMIFEEKSSGVLDALRVGPVGAGKYLLAKVLATLTHTAAPAFILLLFARPDALAIPGLWLMIFVTAVGYAMVGAIFGVLLKSMFDGLYVLVTTVFVMMLPLFAYFMPSLGHLGLKWMPTWGALYGFRAALFPTGRSDDMMIAVQSMLPAFVVMGLLAFALVHYRLLRRSA